MKLIITFLLSLFTFAGMQTSPKEGIQTAIANGDATALGAYFDEQIELKILAQEDIYSKSQAALVVKNFFSKNAVDTFTIKHVIDKKNNAEFMIGHLTAGGENFRVYILVKDQKLIQQLRIEKEE